MLIFKLKSSSIYFCLNHWNDIVEKNESNQINVTMISFSENETKKMFLVYTLFLAY